MSTTCCQMIARLRDLSCCMGTKPFFFFFFFGNKHGPGGSLVTPLLGAALQLSPHGGSLSQPVCTMTHSLTCVCSGGWPAVFHFFVQVRRLFCFVLVSCQTLLFFLLVGALAGHFRFSFSSLPAKLLSFISAYLQTDHYFSDLPSSSYLWVASSNLMCTCMCVSHQTPQRLARFGESLSEFGTSDGESRANHPHATRSCGESLA